MLLALYKSVKKNKRSVKNGKKNNYVSLFSRDEYEFIGHKNAKAAEEKGMEADILLFLPQMQIII